MPWFQKLCRQSGLLIHQIAKPVEKPDGAPKVIVRRTTVTEEVELPASDASSSGASLIHRVHRGTEAQRPDKEFE